MMEPAMPIPAVIRHPLGSGPGVSILATTPITKPMRSVQRKVHDEFERSGSGGAIKDGFRG